MEERKILKAEEGVCPVCGCNELEYGSFEIDGGYGGYDWNCPNCGSQGVELYELVFTQQEVSYKGNNHLKEE